MQSDEARSFGVLTVAPDNRVLKFSEKPANPDPIPGREGVALPLGLRMPWPHAYFGDLAHVNEAGVERYTREVLPVLRDAAADSAHR